MERDLENIVFINKLTQFDKIYGGDIMAGKTVLILDGGIGGIVTANTLQEQLSKEHRIMVVDRQSEYVFTPSLLWVMAGWRLCRRRGEGCGSTYRG